MDTRDRSMATILHADGRWSLRYERHLAHPSEKVWRALTESEHLRHWMPCDLVGERREGAVLELPFWTEQVEKYGIEDPVLYGEIRVWDPPAIFEWTWDADVLRWELQAEGNGTLLIFTTWLGDDDTDGAANTAAGYHACLDQLVELLDTGSGGPPDDSTVERWQDHYAKTIATVPAHPA